jgi:hypothetical protein
MSLVAWFVSVAVGRAAGEQGAGFALLTLDTFLAVLAVGGMELLVFALLPLQFPQRLRPGPPAASDMGGALGLRGAVGLGRLLRRAQPS